jgi:hypothetical protein
MSDVNVVNHQWNISRSTLILPLDVISVSLFTALSFYILETNFAGNELLYDRFSILPSHEAI